jgi:hypothetical protein
VRGFERLAHSYPPTNVKNPDRRPEDATVEVKPCRRHGRAAVPSRE